MCETGSGECQQHNSGCDDTTTHQEAANHPTILSSHRATPSKHQTKTDRDRGDCQKAECHHFPRRPREFSPRRADAIHAFQRYDDLPETEMHGDIHVSGGGKMKVAWFKDPDGNILSVVNGD